MSEANDLYACTKCLTKHPLRDLSSGLMMCKACRSAYPIIKCTYCRSEYQQTQKNTQVTICTKCENNVKQYGKPKVCEYCNIIAAFIGNKCQRCTNSERKYGLPVGCDQCKQKSAFDRKDADKKVDGKLLCWLCTLSYKRALAKTQRAAEKKAQFKIASKNKERHHGHHKRPYRVDVTKMEDMPKSDSASSSPTKIPKLRNDIVDPNASDHIVKISQLTEKYATLEKQLQVKDNQLREKDKLICELKADHFTKEEETRNLMILKKKEYERELETLHARMNSMQREIGSLTKRLKSSNGASAANSPGPVNGNATSSGQEEGAADSPASST